MMTTTKKTLGIPASATTTDSSVAWEARGGFAGQKTVAKVAEKAVAAGWAKVASTSSFGSTETIFSNGEGGKLTLFTSFGSSSRDNRFAITLTTSV